MKGPYTRGPFSFAYEKNMQETKPKPELFIHLFNYELKSMPNYDYPGPPRTPGRVWRCRASYYPEDSNDLRTKYLVHICGLPEEKTVPAYRFTVRRLEGPMPPSYTPPNWDFPQGEELYGTLG